MLSDLVRANAREGDIGGPLAARSPIRIPTRIIGSYPFGHGSTGEVGTSLVIRGRNEAAVEAAASGLLAELTAAGIPAAAV